MDYTEPYTELVTLLTPIVDGIDLSAMTPVYLFNQISNSLVDRGLHCIFRVKSGVQERYGMRSPVIVIKTGNNGGFGFRVSDSGRMEFSLAVALNGRRVTVEGDFDELESVYLSGDSNAVYGLAEVAGSVLMMKTHQLFMATPMSEALRIRADATAKAANDPKVVSLFKRD